MSNHVARRESRRFRYAYTEPINNADARNILGDWIFGDLAARQQRKTEEWRNEKHGRIPSRGNVTFELNGYGNAKGKSRSSRELIATAASWRVARIEIKCDRGTVPMVLIK